VPSAVVRDSTPEDEDLEEPVRTETEPPDVALEDADVPARTATSPPLLDDELPPLRDKRPPGPTAEPTPTRTSPARFAEPLPTMMPPDVPEDETPLCRETPPEELLDDEPDCRASPPLRPVTVEPESTETSPLWPADEPDSNVAEPLLPPAAEAVDTTTVPEPATEPLPLAMSTEPPRAELDEEVLLPAVICTSPPRADAERPPATTSAGAGDVALPDEPTSTRTAPATPRCELPLER